MPKFPALFISHGAPDLLLHPSPARTFLTQLGKKLDKPKAILMISAHWGTEKPTVSKVRKPDTIHDFWGFDSKLNSLSYQATGAPDLADRVSQLLSQANIKSGIDAHRGLDHGAWNPLMLIYPDADIPVTQLSIQPYLTPSHHLQIGRALAPLRESEILIIASGSVTHNLREFGEYRIDAPPPEWVLEFSDWLSRILYEKDTEALLDYRHLAPYAEQNHPTAEHLLPLFVALGAGGVNSTELHSSYTYGVLSMAAYAFE